MSDLLRLPYNLRLLAVVTFALSMGWSGLNRFAAPYLRDNGVDVMFIGFFFSVTSVVGALASPIGGTLADIWGRRPVLTAGRLIGLVGWAVILLVPGNFGMIAGAVLVGCGWIAAAAVKALIAESAPADQIASAFALNGSVDNAAAVIVPLIVGVLSDRLGLRAMLIMMLLPYALGVGLTTRLRETMVRESTVQETAVRETALAEIAVPETTVRETRDSRSGAGAKIRPASPLDGVRYMFSTVGRGALMMGIIWVLTGFMAGMTQPLWGLYVTDRYGVGYAGVGSLVAANAVGAVLGQVIGGRAADRFGYSRVMVFSLIWTASLWLTMPPAPSPWLFLVLVAASSLGSWLAAPAWEALGAEAAERRVRGAVSGLYSGLFSVGMAIGSGAFGLLYKVSLFTPFYALMANDLTMLCLVVLGMRLGFKGFKRLPSEAVE